MGFVSPVREGLLEQLGVALDPRGNVAADTQSYDRRAKSVRVRRHAARAVARRLGDPRGPAMRRLGRRLPDGRNQPTEVRRSCPPLCGIARISEIRILPYTLLALPIVGAYLYGQKKTRVAWILIGVWAVAQVVISGLTNANCGG